MVSPTYPLHKPDSPSAVKVFLDQDVLPALINAAGEVESVMERIAVSTRANPQILLGLAFGFGAVLSFLFRRARR